MANSVSYGMGQIRYVRGVNYMSNLNFSAHAIETSSISGTKNYQDIVFYRDNALTTFSANESYYLRIGIPQNLSYKMTFDLKLLKGSLSNNGTFSFDNRNQYQEINRFQIDREERNTNAVSRVVLYPEVTYNEVDGYSQSREGKAIVQIVDTKELDSVPQLGELYYLATNDNYYIRNINGGGNLTPAEDYGILPYDNDFQLQFKNDILLNHTWEEGQTTNIKYFDFVFSNKVSGENFNSILLELNRNSYDDDIQWTDSSGNTYNGLHLNLEDIDVKCYQIINMLKNSTFGTNNINSFDNIGVWSHPGAIMSINGEEIRVGQSGYYELNDFNITNFGMVVEDARDKFSLDYQYKI